MRYSRRHYRAVSPPADTQEQILARAIMNRACELGRADREREFPLLTGENADAAIRYQEERIAFHAAILKDPNRPNHGRPAADIERLVRGYIAVRRDNPEDEARVAKVVARIVETGECVWHASAQVSGATCWCSPCCTARGESPVRL